MDGTRWALNEFGGYALHDELGNRSLEEWEWARAQVAARSKIDDCYYANHDGSCLCAFCRVTVGGPEEELWNRAVGPTWVWSNEDLEALDASMCEPDARRMRVDALKIAKRIWADTEGVERKLRREAEERRMQEAEYVRLNDEANARVMKAYLPWIAGIKSRD